MAEITIQKMIDGTYTLNYINGEWLSAYGLTKKQAEFYKKNFYKNNIFEEIENKFGWQ